MINWRNGKGGFVGGLKNIIGGVFRYAHSITSTAPLDAVDSVVCFPGTLKDITLNGILKINAFGGVLVSTSFNGILNTQAEFDGITRDLINNGTLKDIELPGKLQTDC